MKRWRLSLLVWLLCLSLPISAASAPYLHLHADADHASEHHDGREVHRHGPPDAEHDSAPDEIPTDGVTDIALGPVAATKVASGDGDAPGHAPPVDVILPGAPPAVGGAPEHPPRTDAAPDHPDSRPAALRGPPRF